MNMAVASRSTSAVLAALSDDPDSVALHEELLDAYVAEGDLGSRGRIDCILWLVSHDPTNVWCRTPLAHVSPTAVPDGYEAIRRAWLDQVGARPADVRVLCGAASFITYTDPEGSLDLLRRAAALSPDDPELWVEVGRLSRAPDASLAAFAEARRRGARHPNLAVWIALSAARAGDMAAADAFARELLALVGDARRQYGAKLDWPEDGRELWRRARAESVDDGHARQRCSVTSAPRARSELTSGCARTGRPPTSFARCARRESGRPPRSSSVAGPPRGRTTASTSRSATSSGERFRSRRTTPNVSLHSAPDLGRFAPSAGRG